MKTILKLLLTLTTTSTISQQIQSFTVYSNENKNIDIEEFELKREPNILFQTPLDINRKFNSIPIDELTGENEFNRFISLEELNLDQAKEYFYDSEISLHFEKPSIRSTNGYSISQIFQDANFTNEFSFNISLEKEETYKVVQKDFTFYDEVNGYFIYTQLNLKITRITNQLRQGITLDGTIKESVKWESWVEQRESTITIGRDLNGILVLSNLNMNFEARKNQFKEQKEEQKEIPVFESKSYINEANSWLVLSQILSSTKQGAQYYGLDPYEASSKIIWQKFDPNTRTRRVCFGLYSYKQQAFIKENLIADIKFESRDNLYPNEIRYMQVSNEFKNYEDTVKRTKKLISNQYDIDEDKIIFNKNTTFNKEHLSKWNSNVARLEYFINYNNKNIRIEVYYKNSRRLVEKEKFKLEDIKFNFFNSKGLVDKEQILESNKSQSDFEFKKIQVSEEEIFLNLKESKIIFIPNGNSFRNITFKTSNNIKIDKLNENKFIVTSLNGKNGWVEFDSIDAIAKQRVNVKVSSNDDYFNVDNTKLELDTNSFGIIKLETNHLDKIKIINSNIDLNIEQSANNLKISSTFPGKYKFKIYSELLKEFIDIEINVNKINQSIKYSNEFYINKLNTQGEILLENIYSDEYDYLNVENSNPNLITQQIDNKIYFIAKAVGEYIITISFKEEKFEIPIYIVKEFNQSTENINNLDELKINKKDFNILDSKNLNYSIKNNEYVFSKINPNKESILKLIDKQGNIIIKNINTINSKTKSNSINKKLIPLILIPISFGIAGLIIFIIKKQTNKKSKNTQ